MPLSVEVYAVRHTRTGNFLSIERSKAYRGATHWNGEETGKVPRLFKRKTDVGCFITAWLKGTGYNLYESGPFGDEYLNVAYKDVGRKREDLEIVPMLLQECTV